ncbi:hypothetical protein D6C99_02643 [Aureobasidium pullulans]|nr:hypothetical protein D6C99_02643 [Aureobasidium pullulans]
MSQNRLTFSLQKLLMSRVSLVTLFLLSILPIISANPHAISVQLSAGAVSVGNGTTGRVMFILSPNGTDPLDDTDDTTTQDFFFGMNVNNLHHNDTIKLSGGTRDHTDTGVFGWPLETLNDIPVGNYRAQAFLKRYDTATRSDGSVVRLKFPCGDGSPPVSGVGDLASDIIDVHISGKAKTIKLLWNNTVPFLDFSGHEIGGCAQGNYEDTQYLKHIKIRSKKLSDFWGRDMFLGANVLLPHGYNAHDNATRYPVIYSQNHWAEGDGPDSYSTKASFKEAWDSGVIPASGNKTSRETPKMILIAFRHETPYYDDSYAVNTANLGPYGDAINEELIPYLEARFNTIPKPYARIQDGGSTGGWESAANLIFRPDLFGACFSSYPDSLDFHKHQAIPLYNGTNAYKYPNGSDIPSIREFVNGTQQVLASTATENHWELTFGTSSRSSLQWDIWNAVFGIQGLNGYPLEPWNKVTGEIYPEAVKYWESMDLAHHIVTNWNSSLRLGEVLRDRVHISVGTWDDYFLNEGVAEFKSRVETLGGQDWATISILPEKTHGGFYRGMEAWDYLELVKRWVDDHAPDGATPLHANLTLGTSRGNTWNEVIGRGGHQAALARQSDPVIKVTGGIVGTVGSWDPGMKLVARWVINNKTSEKHGCTSFNVTQGDVVRYSTGNAKINKKAEQVQLWVTGRKIGYVEETRKSNRLSI